MFVVGRSFCALSGSVFWFCRIAPGGVSYDVLFLTHCWDRYYNRHVDITCK